MIVLTGALGLIIMSAIGIRKMHKKLEEDEWAFFSVIQWIGGGLIFLAITILIDEIINQGRELIVTVCILVGCILLFMTSIIIEKVIRINVLRKKKIKEYDKREREWEEGKNV